MKFSPKHFVFGTIIGSAILAVHISFVTYKQGYGRVLGTQTTSPQIYFDSLTNETTPTPTLTPTPTAAVTPPTTYAPTPFVAISPTSSPTPTFVQEVVQHKYIDHQQLISKYASEYGVNPHTLSVIGQCESGFNPNSVNGPYAGAFQFHAGTWVSTRNAMGLDPDPSLRFDLDESIKTASFKMARDGTGAWPACSDLL